MKGKVNIDADGVIRNGETADDILDGRFRIIQKKTGYRFSLDALLLAHFVRMKKGDALLDLGTGSAVIPLLLYHRWGCSRVAGIEIQPELADMAGRTLALNGLSDQIGIIEGDIRSIEQYIAPRSFDAVTFNPPYRKLQSGKINPLPEKAQARHEIHGAVGDFIKAAAHAVRASGRIFLIYPARRLAELISQMRHFQVEPKRLRIVHSRAETEGEFVLVEGIVAGGEELTVLPPLFIYEENGVYTPAMQEIFTDLCVAAETGAG
ncbi:MAG: tRNA1(Val) (adenine(37)-N6)-methyltransferase [Syntrophales bacterium]|nr:tRNA1(Val) (adenine(37)-N6)-methyltransferase [Syntrophales bacterium]